MPEELQIDQSKKPIRQGRFIPNLITNVANFGLMVLMGIWFTPYLIRHLGTAAYGLVPLATQMTNIMSILTIALNSAVGRYITISLESGNDQQARQYFNTSLFGSIVLSILLVVFGYGLVRYASWLIAIPAGLEFQTQLLFIGTVSAFILNTLKTPFDVSTFCRNRFDLRNGIAMAETLFKVGTVVLLFRLFYPQLLFVGVGILIGIVVSTLGAVGYWRKLTPSLNVSRQDIRIKSLRDLTATGSWVALNMCGSILFLNVDLWVVNRLLGPVPAGRYAAVMQWSMLLRSLGGVLGGLFTPSVLYFYAGGDLPGLIAYCRRAVKFVGLMLALPIGIICGLSGPILELWLGPDFKSLGALMSLMTFHLCVNLSVLPLFSIQIATNRVRLPGLITLALGFVNLLTALWLGGFCGWGMYGVAAAGAIVLSVKNFFFTPLYAAYVLKSSYLTFFREILNILALTGLVSGLLYISCFLWYPNHWVPGLMVVIVVILLYGYTVFTWFLSHQDRKMIYQIIGWLRKD